MRSNALGTLSSSYYIAYDGNYHDQVDINTVIRYRLVTRPANELRDGLTFTFNLLSFDL